MPEGLAVFTFPKTHRSKMRTANRSGLVSRLHSVRYGPLIFGRAGIYEFRHARHMGIIDRSEEHRSVKLLIDQQGDATVARLERWP